MSKRLFYILAISAVFLFSCRGRSGKQEAFIFPGYDSLSTAGAEKLSDEALDDISRNISSPVEIADIFRRMSVPFSATYLATSIDANRLETNFNKALKLGILGADLGYLNMYGKTGNAVDVLLSIKKLADGIGVGQFFDFETLKRLSLNKSDVDSLFLLSNNSYNQIDSYLRENKRGHLSALMLTGVWIECQYLATKVIKQYPDTLLRSRIGEQKTILNDLLMLIAPYCNVNEEFRNLCQSMQNVREMYKDVQITYSTGEPEIKEKDGSLVVVQTEQSRVYMSDKQLDAIIVVSDKLRRKMINEK